MGDVIKKRDLPAFTSASASNSSPDAARPPRATEMTFRLYWPGMDHAVALRSLRFLGEKVRPLVTA